MQFLRVIRPKFDWAQVPDDYPPREQKPDIVEAIKASDDVQPPVGGTNKSRKEAKAVV
jgi:hypothetical protein